MDVATQRLILHRIGPAEAARIVAGHRGPDEVWAPDYPFADEIDPLTSLAASEESDHPFTLYAVRERTTTMAIGGIGFFGPPEDGIVEVGYGLVPSARGRGYATEALQGAVGIARAAGARRIIADTAVENIASLTVLRTAGFTETRRTDEVVHVALDL